MKRPLAYITAAWCGSDAENAEQAAQYCRAVYEAGYAPICPTLFLPLFLNDPVPQEHKDGIDMARDYLRRARVLVVCGGKVDETRILTEAALFADKCSIDEELTRLSSHIKELFRIAEEETVGRKLDFLIQEFNRECNTVCSKSNDAAITALALKMKNEIEKVREQIQNLE